MNIWSEGEEEGWRGGWALLRGGGEQKGPAAG